MARCSHTHLYDNTWTTVIGKAVISIQYMYKHQFVFKHDHVYLEESVNIM